jgi:hypothetical protein
MFCSECKNNTFADRPGYPQCLSCGFGTIVNSDHTQCEFDCNGLNVNNLEYSLSDISYWSLDLEQKSNNKTMTVSGTLCGYNPFCENVLGQPLNSYICNSTMSTLELAKTITFLPQPQQSIGMEVVYETEFLGCKTVLNLLCDPDAGIGSPEINAAAYPSNVQSTESYIDFYQSNCLMFLQWPSLYAVW